MPDALTIQENATPGSGFPDAYTRGIRGIVGAVVNSQIGTVYTLQASDNGKIVTFNNGSAITVTLPSGLGAGFNCGVVQLGVGQVEFVVSGTILNSYSLNTHLLGRYAAGSLIAYAADIFILSGALG